VRTRTGAVAAAVVVALGAAGCSSAGLHGSGASVAATSSLGSASQRPSVSVAPADGSRAVRPDTPVVVTVAHGAVKTVQLETADGKIVQGRVDGAGGWQATDALKPATTYTVKVTAGNQAGVTTTTTSFTTLTPKAYNRVVLVPGDDWTVGVGMPVVATFATPVANRTAAEKALTVSSTPTVKGAWRWVSSTQVQWRPEKYWPSGTKVKVSAAVGGVELAPGVWGRRTVTSSFAVGHAQISTVDVNKDKMTVRRDGKVINVIPVTTGLTTSKPGFVTRGGIKVIMSRESSVRMDAASTGTDPKDPNYYNLVVHWALRLTYSGEFLHAAPWSVAAQGRQNVSHGCTGMSDANAKWMYDHSQIGDVVVYQGSKRPLEPGNGYTAWNMSYSDWTSGA
jgi:lipoprotein-anchoring transpeptidase ErfK/SrfK